MAGLIHSGGGKLKVCLLLRQLTVECAVKHRRSVALGHFIARRNGQVNKACVRMHVESVGSLVIGAHEAVSVRYLDALQSLSLVINDTTADAERRSI